MEPISPQISRLSPEKLSGCQPFEIKEKIFRHNGKYDLVKMVCLYIGDPNDEFVAYELMRKKIVILRFTENQHDDTHLITREIFLRYPEDYPTIVTYDECEKWEKAKIVEEPEKVKRRRTPCILC